MTATVGDASLAERLRDIVRTAAASGRPLPSEPALATSLGVSRPALREELARLEQAGLIRRRRGASTIANPGAFDLTVRFDEQVEYAEVLREAGFAATVELLESGVVALGGADAEELHVGPSTPALRTVKRWRADGRAVMVATDVIPLTVGRQDEAAGVASLDPGTGLFDLVRSLSGDHVEWELTWPGATVAPSSVRRWLELPSRAAVMTLDLVGVCSSGRRAYRATEYHVPGVVRTGFVRTVRA